MGKPGSCSSKCLRYSGDGAGYSSEWNGSASQRRWVKTLGPFLLSATRASRRSAVAWGGSLGLKLGHTPTVVEGVCI